MDEAHRIADEVVVALTEQECWDRLAGEELGRLVTRVGDVLDIFPVNYVVDDRTLLFRTAEGSKLFELVSRRSEGEIGTDQMPPLASERVDEAGVALLKKWIVALEM